MTTVSIESIFKQFNLNRKETEAFLELVEIGASPISKWAHHAKIKRTSMYVILEKLLKTGLVSTFVHGNVQHVQPIAVSKITTLLDQRQREIEATKSVLNTELPELLALEKVSSITPKVKFYEGLLRVEAMYDEVLKEKSFYAFFHPERVKTMMPNYYHKIALTLRKNGGTAKEILVNCKDAEEYKRLYISDKHKIAVLPKGVTFSSDTIITKDKIFLVGYSKDTIVGTEIWNSELAQTQLTLFELLWNTYS
jgi:sugar-specific transcriptional regulator TrmB